MTHKQTTHSSNWAQTFSPKYELQRATLLPQNRPTLWSILDNKHHLEHKPFKSSVILKLYTQVKANVFCNLLKRHASRKPRESLAGDSERAYKLYSTNGHIIQ